MKDLVHYIAQELLEHPEEIQINEIAGHQTTILELKVHPEDLGKIIGRQGRTAKALRTIINAAAMKKDKRVLLEIIETGSGENV